MEKRAIRDRIWDGMEERGIARFPFPPHDRIPNFAGADDAADRLAARREFEAAETVKSNPDAPQLPVRRRALRAGKLVYMAVPRLRDERCFMALDPATIDDVDDAATITSARQYATAVGPEDVEPIDVVVAGSVAVTPTGDRIGKGEGYSDLEYAILAEFDLVEAETTVATTVHEFQVIDEAVPTEAHDVPMDLVVTPERVIEVDRKDERPAGIDWDRLDEDRIEAIPILKAMESLRESE